MKLLTRETLAREAAKRWRQQYPPNGIKDGRNVYQELKDLGPNPNPDDVDRIIGNTSWTRVPDCDECQTPTNTLLHHNYGHPNTAVVQIGENPDYESRTAYICGECLLKALQLMDN